jgi:uncharacterized protein
MEAATAVPAFIGYTEKAVDGGHSLLNQPWRISSMDEYIAHFGNRSVPRFGLELIPDPPPAAAAVDAKAARDQVTEFSCNGKQYKLTRKAAEVGGRHLMVPAMQHFFANGGAACYIVSVGDHDDAIGKDPLIAGIQALEQEQEPTLVLVPDAVLLDQAGCAAVQRASLLHCGAVMKNRFAVLDVWGGDRPPQDRLFARFDCIETFRGAIGADHLEFGAAYYPWLKTTWVAADDPDFSVLGLTTAALAALVDRLHNDLSVTAMGELNTRTLNAAREQMNLMPPSAAIAGLYTMVDKARGVWKAPANVSLNAVTAPAVEIAHEVQEDLNVHTSGKSINAIRSFIDEGTLVWGARTLAGNSLDWRYVNVRRTMIMLEESCRQAAKALAFEPNVVDTWLNLKSMIANFLTGIWKRGGLAGAVPDDAFSVHVGLGDTMTPEDMLEGILRVTVLVAITRPAEFIEITFQQQMRKSGSVRQPSS